MPILLLINYTPPFFLRGSVITPALSSINSPFLERFIRTFFCKLDSVAPGTLSQAGGTDQNGPFSSCGQGTFFSPQSLFSAAFKIMDSNVSLLQQAPQERANDRGQDREVTVVCSATGFSQPQFSTPTDKGLVPLNARPLLGGIGGNVRSRPLWTTL